MDARTHVKPGDEVGAERWPYSGAHPGCWGRPWKGVVLEVDDPRAWAGSIAFPGESPDPAAVRQHVAWCHGQGLLRDKVPVLWDFGPHGPKVYWSELARLRPYEADVEAWEAARADALRREAERLAEYEALEAARRARVAA